MSLNSDDSDGPSTKKSEDSEESFDDKQYEGLEEPNESINDSDQTQTTTSKGQQQQQLCRREKNRISKLKSRMRKRELINSLQAKVNQLNAVHNELRAENEQLHQEFAGCINDLGQQGRTGLGQNVLHDANQHTEHLGRFHVQTQQRQGSLINQTFQPTASVSQVALGNQSSISTSAVLPNMVLPWWSGNQQGVPRNNNGTLNIGGISQSRLLFGKPKDSMFDGTNNKRRRF